MINLSDKKILITGAHGFLGQHLIKNLLEKRKVSKESLFLPSIEELDLRKWEDCQKAVQGQDVVIHLAAKVGGIGFNQENPGELFYDNIIMGVQLMEAARQEGVEKFVSIGTVCCYPKFTPVPFREEDIWNGYPEETNAPYGLAKKMLLVQGEAYKKQYGFNSIFLLMLNLFGPGDNFDPQSSHVIPALIHKIHKAKKENKDYVELWGTGRATRGFIYVEDAAEGIISAAESYDRPEPINLGSEIEISIKDLAETIAKLMNFEGEIRWDNSKPDGQPKRHLDVSKAEREFGFKAETDFIQGLRNTIFWYENYYLKPKSNSEDMNKSFEFNLKTKLKFGAGEALKLSGYLKEIGLKKIGLIVDSAVYDTDYFKSIIDYLNKDSFEKIKVWKYDLGGEPDYDSLDRIRPEFIDIDCFVAIGGGSVIDFAKGLATLANNPGKAIEYRGFPKDINPSLPIIALPTTAGTASEVTYNAVFIDKNERKKLGINTMDNFPVLAILDPRLTLSCPKPIMVSSGMDALTHILESYVATKSNQITKMFAKEAFKLVFNSLSGDLNNISVQENLQLGAYLAGISLMNSGSGPSGALSYTLGVNFKVPHGLAGAVFLPYIVKHNVEKGYDYSELYDLIDSTDKSFSIEEKSRIFLEKLFELSRKLEVPDNLGIFGVNQENINLLFKDVEGYQAAFNQNPISFLVEDGKKLLTKLINKKCQDLN